MAAHATCTNSWPALDTPLRDLALAQMQSGPPVIMLTLLATGDVMLSIMDKPGSACVAYARVDGRTRRFEQLASHPVDPHGTP
jgi:hypothetical protein